MKSEEHRMNMQTQEMTQTGTPGGAARLIRQVRQYTRRKYTAEDKIRIVLEGFRKELPVSDLCRREGLSSAIYYKWLKDFMEAGKARLRSDNLREASKDEVLQVKRENEHLKGVLGEMTLKLHLFKKSVVE